MIRSSASVSCDLGGAGGAPPGPWVGAAPCAVAVEGGPIAVLVGSPERVRVEGGPARSFLSRSMSDIVLCAKGRKRLGFILHESGPRAMWIDHSSRREG